MTDVLEEVNVAAEAVEVGGVGVEDLPVHLFGTIVVTTNVPEESSTFNEFDGFDIADLNRISGR